MLWLKHLTLAAKSIRFHVIYFHYTSNSANKRITFFFTKHYTCKGWMQLFSFLLCLLKTPHRHNQLICKHCRNQTINRVWECLASRLFLLPYRHLFRLVRVRRFCNLQLVESLGCLVFKCRPPMDNEPSIIGRSTSQSRPSNKINRDLSVCPAATCCRWAATMLLGGSRWWIAGHSKTGHYSCLINI